MSTEAPKQDLTLDEVVKMLKIPPFDPNKRHERYLCSVRYEETFGFTTCPGLVGEMHHKWKWEIVEEYGLTIVDFERIIELFHNDPKLQFLGGWDSYSKGIGGVTSHCTLN